MSKKFKTQCIVPNCNSGKSVKSNRFPKDSKQCQRWINAVKNPFLETLELKEIQTYRVCQLHFTRDSFSITAERPRLKWDAVPSLRLPFEKSPTETMKIDLQINEKDNKNVLLNRRIKEKTIENDFTPSYESNNTENENYPQMEDDNFLENDLFQEANNKNRMENILSHASKEFQRAERGKEITIAFKIRAKLYKNVKKCAIEKLKHLKKLPSKENRKIKTDNCVVPNCKSGRHITKHCFPKDEYVGKKWLKAVKSPFLKKMSYNEIRKKRFAVCCLHFPENSLTSTKYIKPRLKVDTIPSLELPEKLIRKEDMIRKKPIDLPRNDSDVPNIKIDPYSTITSILSYNTMLKSCDFSHDIIRESSFELFKNDEDLNVRYQSINDIGMFPFVTKYSKEVET